MIPKLVLKPDREKSLLRHHPWVFSGAVSGIIGAPGLGDTVDVYSASNEFLAKAAYSPQSQITARVWSWDSDAQVGRDFFYKRLNLAIEARQTIIDPVYTNAKRLVHGESDGMPGLIVDQYDKVVVAQFLSAGAERWRGDIVEILQSITDYDSIYERSDVDVRQLEGLPLRTGLLLGEEPPPLIKIVENGIDYVVDIRHGHKTGFYLDQRSNRNILRKMVKSGDVLDCFCYTGAFAINALLGGASSVTAIDSSEEALGYVVEHTRINHLSERKVNLVEGDVFKILREYRDRAQKFDVIILDPPKFAPTSTMVERAARGYKDINLLALKLLREGGMLFTFSCSGGISEDLFQKIVAGAALDARVEAKIIYRMHQDVDHPVALNFPEGAYLKGFVIQV